MLQDKEEKETKWTRVVAIMARVPEYWAILHSRIRPGRWMVTFPGVYKREGTFLEEKSQGISEEAKKEVRREVGRVYIIENPSS